MGRFGKGTAYTDRTFTFKPVEVKEALELVQGPKGSENIHCFSLVFAETCGRLQNFIQSFAYSFKERVLADYGSQTGFYKPGSLDSELIYVSAELGVQVPFAREEVIKSESAGAKLFDDLLLLAAIFGKLKAE